MFADYFADVNELLLKHALELNDALYFTVYISQTFR